MGSRVISRDRGSVLGAIHLSLDCNPLSFGPAFHWRPDSSAGKSVSLSISSALFLFSLSYSRSVTGSGSWHLLLFPGPPFLVCTPGLFVSVLVMITTALAASVDGAVVVLGCCQCLIVLSYSPLAPTFSWEVWMTCSFHFLYRC